MIGFTAEGFLAFAVDVALAAVALALFLAFVRLVRGPTLADRVIALDMITLIVVIMLTLFAMHVGEEAYLDAAVALALVGFLATVAFARYIDRSPNAGSALDAPKPAPDRPSNGPGDLS